MLIAAGLLNPSWGARAGSTIALRSLVSAGNLEPLDWLGEILRGLDILRGFG